MVATPVRLQRKYLNSGHIVQWRTASSLWRQRSQDQASLKEPVILRFASDRFMEEFMAVAQQAPQRFGEWQARYETWRQLAPTPSLGLPASGPPAPSGRTLKLYQPAHQRYYLITASLVCRQPGMPDKSLNLGQQEKVSFVVRRMMRPEASTIPQEHAWVNGGWQPVDGAAQLATGEETFPMFPTTYREADGLRRRLFAGLIPVTERERYLTAPRRPQPVVENEPPALEDNIDRLVTLLNIDVLAPWRELLRQVGDPFPATGQPQTLGVATQAIRSNLVTIAGLDSGERSAELSNLRTVVRQQRDGFQVSSWYGLLDFATFLETYLPDVWAVVQGRANRSGLSLAQRTLFDALNAQRFSPSSSFSITSEDIGDPDRTDTQNKYFGLLAGLATTAGDTSFAEALQDVTDYRDFLESTTRIYDTTDTISDTGWPPTKFLLSGRGMADLVNRLDDSYDPRTGERLSTGLIHAALAEEAATATRSLPQTPLAREVSRSARPEDVAENQFVIRCVYQRPNCPASIHPTVVSDPTEAFEMAAYYDPDAPARPIRIPMPLDTTPAGLRKYAKNTMFVISDTLGCQIERARSITFGDLVRSVLPWPLNKKLDTSGASCSASGGLDFGKLCTLSIPIITICALILLMIFVLLLDIIFRWVPYLIFCLPIPGLKAKGDE
jgi:hypothetical protein